MKNGKECLQKTNEYKTPLENLLMENLMNKGMDKDKCRKKRVKKHFDWQSLMI